MKKVIVYAVFLFVMVGITWGQATSVNGGSIQGTITDSSGAVVAGATLTIVDPDTGLNKTVKTDSAGFYSVGPLNPGNYTVSVTAEGLIACRLRQ